MTEKNYTLAVKLGKKAVRKKSDEHRFYFTLAKAYTQLGDQQSVSRYLKKAMRYAHSEEYQTKYSQELELVKKHRNRNI